MRNQIILLFTSILLFHISCSNDPHNFNFTIKGKINNVSNQKIYLEELFFNQKNPEVVDTADIINGTFSLSAKDNEEGLYRLRLEKDKSGYIVINDQKEISFLSDINDVDLNNQQINSPANKLLKTFMLEIVSRNKSIQSLNKILDSTRKQSSDSTSSLMEAKIKQSEDDYKIYLTNFINNCQDPVVSMFAMGYTQNLDADTVKKMIDKLTAKFPNHTAAAELIQEYKKYLDEKNKVNTQTQPIIPSIGMIAPDFTMNDINDKPFSLSQLRGHYVLVDFWASWCGPCRGENPNVVLAFNKFKNKNFTVLGVSLDEDKTAWLKAIKDDQLTWKHVSDLKGWKSEAVSLFGFDGIPYNVLIDPKGKILAKELRENELDEFLSKTLK